MLWVLFEDLLLVVLSWGGHFVGSAANALCLSVLRFEFNVIDVLHRTRK